MDFINDRCAEFKAKEGIAVATYGTPAESLCGTQVKQFRKMFGIVEGVSDKEYFNNSFHVNVDADINPFQKQDAEYNLFHKMNGGHIQYCRVLTKDNLQANLALCDRAMDYGYYFGINFADCYCADCGHNFLDGETCPHCGSANITEINRVSGYLGYSRIAGDSRMNEAKLADIKDRKSM
jgi:ribonucleoside-triphosphate reductase